MVVTLDDNADIDFYPATLEKEVWQNVKTILTTTKFSVPLDRDFGIDASVIDLPLPVAKAKLTDEIMRAVNQYEPRASIKEISFDANLDGKLQPKIILEVIN